jgi:hypothetical protein
MAGEKKCLAGGFMRGGISISRGILGEKFSGIVEGGILSRGEICSKGEGFCTENTCWHLEQRTFAPPPGMRSSSRLNLVRHSGQVISIGKIQAIGYGQ